MRRQRTRAAVALVVADAADRADDTRWQLGIDEHGALTIPALDLELTAHRLPLEESADLTQLLAVAANTQDRPMPSSRGDQPWDAYADAAGSLREDLAPAGRDATVETPHAPGGDEERPVPFHATGSRSEPIISDEVRCRIESADPHLDADLAEWHDPSSPRPKVRLLGPVLVSAQGELPVQSPRRSWNTEVVAYLATRPGGVTAERFGTDLWPDDPDIAGKTKVRQAIMIVRKWLGTDPDGQDYLPKGTTAAATGGLVRYEVREALVDSDLFRRLRLRGTARGADGIEDLWQALRLVSGTPFDERRPGGYGWLTCRSITSTPP